MQMINDTKQATAFAPATCGNVIVGFDCLGLAIDGVGDCVTLLRRDDQQLVIENIEGNQQLSYDKQKNVAAAVIDYVCQQQAIDCGFSIYLNKGIPLSSGMGGSAASAVAALTVLNQFLLEPMSKAKLAEYALYGEALCSGQAHADNVVPAVYGGITLTHQLKPLAIVNLPVPAVYCVLIHPDLSINTRDARALLSTQLPLTQHIQQTIYLASFISALYQNDLSLLQQSLHDVVIEPQRKSLIPGFDQVQQAALDAGAFAASLSGSGPSLLALTADENQADNVAQAMQAIFQQQSIDSQYYISPINQQGAYIMECQ